MDSSESLEVEEKRLADEQNDKLEDDDDVDEEEQEEEDDEEEGATIIEESQHSELRRLGDESKRLETLEVVAPSSAVLCKDDQSVGLRVTSASETHVEVKSQSQAQNGVSHSHQEVSGSATVQLEAQNQNDVQSSGCPASLSELSPTSVTQPISSAPSPIKPERRLSPLKVDNKFLTEADLRDSTDQKALTLLTSPTPGARSPIPDGYNWRKYGQKQVKSPKGSRSYYKCTYSDCFAKKIECSDHSGQVIEIVSKGMHTHDPPRKNHSTRESRVALTPRAVFGNTVTDQPKTAKDSDPPTSSKETIQVPTISDRKRQKSSGSNDSGGIQVKDEQYAEPEPKQRLKKSNAACPGAIVKAGKKPKFVVHTAGDVGISGDGYRWRKYGQKMVKGNPHPRNYYRCTSAGCPVRKHIENAVDNTNAVIITYKGVHDHDMPVPKKRHGPPSAPLIAAAGPASMNNSQLKKTETPQNQVTSTQWSVSKEGELTGETVDVGGEKEKAIESARTLLSIGFEIKPC